MSETLIIKKGEKKYPSALLDLVDPPEELHIRGTWNPHTFTNALAVVGSRKMTPYGASVVEKILPPLIKEDFIIVSGFMYGIDTKAHQTALKLGGVTVAVLGQGLNYMYPRENKGLYEEILKRGGCIVSEYPDDFKPEQWTFPKRNRIVAALSLKGTLVVEAAEQSGSLITASYADALNRPLFAIPGPIHSETSRGTNRLIKDRIAQMATSSEDIISQQNR